VAQAFGLNPDKNLSWMAKVAGYTNPVYLSPPDSHFSEVSLLGIDFCSYNGFTPQVIAGDLMVKYYIGNDWQVNPKPKL
jgi:hypothetical protein